MLIRRMLERKERARQYRARRALLPAGYRGALDAVQRYTLLDPPEDGDDRMRLLEDVLDLFEDAAAAGTPLLAVIGESPVEFADGFRRNYPMPTRATREQDRLGRSILELAGL